MRLSFSGRQLRGNEWSVLKLQGESLAGNLNFSLLGRAVSEEWSYIRAHRYLERPRTTALTLFLYGIFLNVPLTH
jgi:hypothetical protein